MQETALACSTTRAIGPQGGHESKSHGLEIIPEVQNVLEASLSKDSTATVPSVFGQWFPWLVLIDAEWSKANELSIFPSAPDLAYLRDAAWNTYIRMCPAYENMFDILCNQYRDAIDRIQPPSASGRAHGDPDIGLANHLMVFYLRGKINLKDLDGLLKHLFSNASDDLMADAIGFVGRSVENDEGQIPQPTLDRLMTLWQERMNTLRTSGEPGNHQQELAAFGWWFRSSQ